VTIVENLARIEERIQTACARAGRSREEVLLVAVSKTQPAEAIEQAIQAGIRAVGENRVQEAAAKRPLARGPAEWHLVGHLQSNKAGKAVGLFSVIQSLDSPSLAQELQRRCVQADSRIRVLLEVNTSAEESKFGVPPDALLPLAEAVLRLNRLELTGLMTIGPGLAVTDPEASRPCFKKLRYLAEDARRQFAIPLPHLSMGMSSDFEQGIEEGATVIRVGTAIFGTRN
jgi:PLP dependent protein